MPDEDYTPAHPDAVRDLWLSCAKPALSHGTLEKMPTTVAKTPLEIKQKKSQEYWLTRKSFGSFPVREYERIFGRKK